MNTQKIKRAPTNPTPLSPSNPLPSRPRSERLRRIARAHNPANDPPFTFWHGLGLLACALLFFGQQNAPGLLGDLSRLEIGDWQVGIYARLTALFLAGIAVFAVRAMHPGMYVAMGLEITYLCLRLGETRIIQEPLTLSSTCVLLAFSIISIRIIIRPNEYEQARRGPGEPHDHE